MPGMQEVETAVGEDDAFTIVFAAGKPQNRLFERKNSRVQRISKGAQCVVNGKVREGLVYHAKEWRRVSAAVAAAARGEGRDERGHRKLG
jgi:hypothetical protein